MELSANAIFKNILIEVRGAGDLGSGVIYRLQRAGFPVVATELAHPRFVRRTVSYGSAVYEQEITVDGLTARLVEDTDAALALEASGKIPVLIDEGGDILDELKPTVVVDARMAKQSQDTTIKNAPLVVALGPGFETGVHCHCVVETMRGHCLGRVFWNGHAEPDTGLPGAVGGITAKRVLRAPTEGYVVGHRQIGDVVRAGEVIATVGGMDVAAQFDGVVRGLIHHSVLVPAGLKIGDIDPRAQRAHCFTISDKALAVGGGVVEAVLHSDVVRQRILGGVTRAT